LGWDGSRCSNDCPQGLFRILQVRLSSYLEVYCLTPSCVGSAGALIGTTYGIVKRRPPLVHAINSSINSGIAGLSFFGMYLCDSMTCSKLTSLKALREYVAGPVLVHTMPWQTYVRRRNSLRAEGSAPVSSDPMSISETRSHKLLDTAIAGAGTGGILNTWRRVFVAFCSNTI
jgi:hypothetical protein